MNSYDHDVMTTASHTAVTRREPELLGQTVAIVGGQQLIHGA